jgi:hypothetical protein
MKLMIVVVVLALYGCGGSAFSAAESDGGLGAGAVDTGGQADAAPMADGGTAADAADSAVLVNDSEAVDSNASDSAVAIDSAIAVDSGLIDSGSTDDACTPVTHNNGVGASWTDCVPLGTYNETQAMAACEADAVAVVLGETPFSCTETTCGSGTDTVELQFTLPGGGVPPQPPTNEKIFWTYAGSNAGYVGESVCPTHSDQMMWN